MPELKLWLIEQSERNSYGTYDSAVVVAPDEERARNIHPSAYVGNYDTARTGDVYDSWAYTYGSWAKSPAAVTAKFLGVADPLLEDGEVVCASFNAG